MISVSVIEDRFSDIQSSQAGIQGGQTLAGPTARDSAIRTVRRPTRGITLKEDTFATMRVVTGDGKHILLTDAGGQKGSQNLRQTQVYSNFLLQQVNEERMEKQQILETFGEPYIFLFGERARMVSFAGVLLNTFDFNWEAEWWENYELYLRGTRCVENDARVFIAFDETLVSGYIIASSASKNSQDRNHVTFQFTMFLTGYTNFSAIGDGTAIPARARELAKKASLSANDVATFGVQGPSALSNTGLNARLQNPQTLAQGITAGLSSVLATWNRAQAVVHNAAQQLSNIAKGDLLRVPFGFTGALAYDSVDLVRDQLFTGTSGPDYGVVKYSEFKDNKDEYIGSSSHYGSSTITNVLADEQNLTSLLRNQAFVDALRTLWLSNGFLIPPEEEAQIASFVVRNGSGLLAAGNTTAWQVAETAATGLSALNMTPSSASRPVSPIPVPG